MTPASAEHKGNVGISLLTTLLVYYGYSNRNDMLSPCNGVVVGKGPRTTLLRRYYDVRERRSTVYLVAFT